MADPLFKTNTMNTPTIEDVLAKYIDEYNSTVNDMHKFKLSERELKMFSAAMQEWASLNRQGCRWVKNMDVRLKAWIERLLKESGILKHGLHPSVHESHNTFLVSIEETFHQERDKWLSPIEPCATSSENYWKQRCEAAEAVIASYNSDDSIYKYEAFVEDWEQLKKATIKNNNMIKELYIKNIAATAENLLMVIRDKQGERLESKVWDLDNAIELYENNCREWQSLKPLPPQVEQREGWISVEDKLPEENKHYIITNGDDVSESWYGRRTKNDTPHFLFTKVSPVTHYMLLPSPPKKYDKHPEDNCQECGGENKRQLPA